MEKIKWGIIGPGNIANNFADGLKGSYSGQLVSIASKSEDRRKNFGDKYDIHPDFRFDSYEDIINSEHIDAIYISTPHTLHAEWTIKAAGKGKHILCEKPGAINFNEGKKIIDAVREAGVFYMEGFMYRCHPQIPKLVDIIKNKIIGDVISIETSFGFDMGKTIPDHRLFNKNLAGGGILDVGLYPISFSRLIAGVATGDKFSEPKFLDAEAKIGETGVDEIAHANLEFKNGIKAKVSTAIRETMKNNAIKVDTCDKNNKCDYKKWQIRNLDFYQYIKTPNNLKCHSAIILVFSSSSGKQQIVLKTKTVCNGMPLKNFVASLATLRFAFLTASLKAKSN